MSVNSTDQNRCICYWPSVKTEISEKKLSENLRTKINLTFQLKDGVVFNSVYGLRFYILSMCQLLLLCVNCHRLCDVPGCHFRLMMLYMAYVSTF